jgi:hypothetical protein
MTSHLSTLSSQPLTFPHFHLSTLPHFLQIYEICLKKQVANCPDFTRLAYFSLNSMFNPKKIATFAT